MKLFNFILIVAVFSAMACSPKYYSPNTQQITLFEEQGDVNLTLIAGASKVEGQAAFAITDQFAAAVNYTKFVRQEVNDANSGEGYIFEVAPGYYTAVGDNLIFETYLQLGFGNFENSFNNQFDTLTTGSMISANAFKVGLQPSLAYKKGNFAAAVSTRVASLNYSNIEGSLFFEGIDQIDYLTENKSTFLIEPALTCWYGFDNIKFQAQYGFSFNLSDSDFPMDNQLFTIGINANLNTGDLR